MAIAAMFSLSLNPSIGPFSQGFVANIITS